MATAGVKRARKAYDVTFKLKAVDFAEKESKEAAARQFGVDPKTIREWCQKKEQLVALKTSGKSKKKRLVGAGRKALDSDHMREGYSTCPVCLSVCVCVCFPYSGTSRNQAYKQQYQRLQRDTGMKYKKGFFFKTLRSEVMASFSHLE